MPFLLKSTFSLLISENNMAYNSHRIVTNVLEKLLCGKTSHHIRSTFLADQQGPSTPTLFLRNKAILDSEC